MRYGTLVIGLGLAGGLVAPALGHHSFAMFESSDKRIDIEGTVREFQWTNPHVFIQVIVPGADGKTTEWSVEGPPINMMARSGWKRTSLVPGDKLTVTIRALKDGTPGGLLVSAKKADGTVLGEAGP